MGRVDYKQMDSSGTHCKTEQSAATTIIAYVLFNVVDASCQVGILMAVKMALFAATVL
jgi:hypothetical protein